MSFHYEGSTKFKCNLHCQKCEATNKNGVSCKRNTCKMLPTCYQHTKSVYGVEVKQSSIEKAGLGLFSCRDFKKNDIICPYKGEILTKKELDERYGKSDIDYSPYAVQMSTDKFMYCSCFRGLGSYANCKTGNNNAKLVVSNPHNTVNVKATKNIKEGQEIFVSYGKNYFRDINTEHRTVKKKLKTCEKCGKKEK